MTRIMVITASVRPVRLGEPITRWVLDRLAERDDVEVDHVDLRELALPFMDEPKHPSTHEYTKPHTIAWSERVSKADAVIAVTPEYNHSYAPALKNAIDYLSREWKRMPIGFVSYGGISGGTRGVVGMLPVLAVLGMVKTMRSVELPFAAKQVVDGVFQAEERQDEALDGVVEELVELVGRPNAIGH